MQGAQTHYIKTLSQEADLKVWLYCLYQLILSILITAQWYKKMNKRPGLIRTRDP